MDRNSMNGARVWSLMLAAAGLLIPQAGLQAARAAQPQKLRINSATAFPAGHGPLTLHGDASEFVLLRPDFKALKGVNLSRLQAVVLHWHTLKNPGPIRQTKLVFLRLLKSHPSNPPKAKVDWSPVPVLSANFAGTLEKDDIRISGFSTAVQNWVTGKWPDHGMLVALNSESRAAAKLTLAPLGGAQAPYFELRWQEPPPVRRR